MLEWLIPGWFIVDLFCVVDLVDGMGWFVCLIFIYGSWLVDKLVSFGRFLGH